MNALIVLVAIVAWCAFAWFTRERKLDMAPYLSKAQRFDAYSKRLDRAIGKESEEQLRREAIGLRVKYRMLLQLAYRAPIPHDHALVPVSPPRVEFTGRPRRRLKGRRAHLRAVA